MTRLRHTIAVPALDRRETESLLPALHEIAESQLVCQADAIPDEEIRAHAERGELTLPRRLRQGERFTAPLDDTARLTTTVRAWDRRAESALKLELASERPDLEAAEGTAEVSFRSAEHPGRLEVSARGALNRWTVFGRRMLWAEGRGRLDWPHWWQAATTEAGGASGAVPLTGEVTATVVRASVSVTPSPGERGEWLLDIIVDIRGRGPLRPLVALGLWVARRRLRGGLAEKLDDMAREWHETLPELPRTPDALLDRYLAELLAEGEDGTDVDDDPDAAPPVERGGAAGLP
ncbi:hypothetical protein [Streptomyces xiamenensis]|uniref:hypothetical protein n=1 Tax=Streptomyces xiamenensis TaxID=408015 RepID=UPI0037D3F7E2